MSRYRRLNIVFDREPDLFAAHIWIAMISIISRRLVAKPKRSKGFRAVFGLVWWNKVACRRP